MGSRNDKFIIFIFRYKLKINIIYYILLFSFIAITPAQAWWFSKTDKEMLAEALQSDEPQKVEKCLNRNIELKNYTAILQLQHHARRMMQKERARLSGKQGATSKDIQASLEPWKKIDQKADASSRKKIVQQQGKN
jgi:hypothetical protein